MAIGEVFIIIGSMLMAFLLGAVGVFMLGSKTTWNYFKVKVSRGKKILLFVKTNFGWKSEVGSINNNLILWKHHKKDFTTTVAEEKSISRFGAVNCAYIHLEQPTTTVSLNKSENYPADFDFETFNNILIRALTQPNTLINDKLLLRVTISLILNIVIAFGIILIYLKLGEVMAKIGTGGVI